MPKMTFQILDAIIETTRALFVVSGVVVKLWTMPHHEETAIDAGQIAADFVQEIAHRLAIYTKSGTHVTKSDEIDAVAKSLQNIVWAELDHKTHSKNGLGIDMYAKSDVEQDRWDMLDITDFRLEDYCLAFNGFLLQHVDPDKRLPFQRSIAFPDE